MTVPLIQWTGAGRINVSGGCVVRMALTVVFVPEAGAVRVDIDNRLLAEPEGYYTATGHVTAERVAALIQAIRPLLAAPSAGSESPPWSNAVVVHVDIASSEGRIHGTVSGGAWSSPLVDSVCAFVHEIAFSPGVIRTSHPPAKRSRQVPDWLVSLGSIACFYAVMLLLGVLF